MAETKETKITQGEAHNGNSGGNTAPHNNGSTGGKPAPPKKDDTQNRVESFGEGASEKRQALRQQKNCPYDLYADNSVHTGKYSLLSFLPKCIFLQFRKVANSYFLLQTIFMAIGMYTELFENNINPVTTAMTLIGVVALAMIFEALDDIARHKQDRVTNGNKTKVIPAEGGDGEEIEIRWDEVKTMDLVVLRQDEAVPADFVVVTSAHNDGLVYVETKNIDGETNLKIKKSNRGFNTLARKGIPEPNAATHVGHDTYADVLKECIHNVTVGNGVIHYEPPNNKISSFSGKVIIDGGDPNPCDKKNLVLRGSIIRNCTWVLGLVIYTGNDTKVRQNTRETPTKVSHLQGVVNKALGIVFLVQFLSVTTCAVMIQLWHNHNVGDHPLDLWYIYPKGVEANPHKLPIFVAFWFTYFILFSNLVPICLYVSLEFANITQAKYINNDILMYNEVIDAPALCRSTNLVQELGQIQYVFSDKTGTLTQNIMRFKCLCVRGYDKIEGFDAGPDSPGFDPKGLNEMRQKGSKTVSDMQQFLTIMAVAHTCTATKVKDAKEGEGEFKYNAESPDEKALVEGAARCGVTFVRREGDVTVVRDDCKLPDSNGKRCWRRYQLLGVNEFNSTRKRMSVIIRVLPVSFDDKPMDHTGSKSGKVYCFCKGADSFIMDLADNSDGWESKHMPLMCKQLSKCAVKGLRTLVMAQKELSEAEFSNWNTKFKEASNAMEGRKEKLMKCGADLETNLRIVGASAIEDKLQEGIANCIKTLHQAKIKLWVLTGDKMETAMNIGKSTEVLQSQMRVIPFDMPEKLQRDHEGAEAANYVQERLKLILKNIGAAIHEHGDPREMTLEERQKVVEVNTKNGKLKKKGDTNAKDASTDNDIQWSDLLDLALVITGPCLNHILGQVDENGEPTEHGRAMEALLKDISVRCTTVIACRVSPLQKALVVRLIRQGVKPEPITLAIGDGANDVSMIQEAHVGVGIRGLEGMQAVNASDFAIGKFRFLQRLLLVHGRWNYRRACKVILYTFYKNMAETWLIFFYSFYTGFSGTMLFEEWNYTLFNSIFCAYPIVAIGIFDQDVLPELSIAQPKLYLSGRMNIDMNMYQMTETVLLSILHSGICFLWPLLAYNGMEQNGIGGYYCFGSTCFTCLVVTCNLRAAFITYTWTGLSFFVTIFSVSAYFAFVYLWSSTIKFNLEFRDTGKLLYAQPLFWCIAIGGPLSCMVFDLFMETIRQVFYHDIIDDARLLQKVTGVKNIQQYALTNPDFLNPQPQTAYLKTRDDHWEGVANPIEKLGAIADRRYVNHQKNIKVGSGMESVRTLDLLKHEKADGVKHPDISTYKAQKFDVEKAHFDFTHVSDEHYGLRSKILIGKSDKNHDVERTKAIQEAQDAHSKAAADMKKRQPCEKSEEDPESAKPDGDNACNQQKCGCWRPVISFMSLFYWSLFCAIFFLTFGIWAVHETHKVVVYEGIYDCPHEDDYKCSHSSESGIDNTHFQVTNAIPMFDADAFTPSNFFDSAGYKWKRKDDTALKFDEPPNYPTNPTDLAGALTAPSLDQSQYRCPLGYQCEIEFHVQEDMQLPLDIFYGVRNFYQNHNRFVFDRCPKNYLEGESVDDCKTFCSTYIDKKSPSSNFEYGMCGLAANSQFSDMIKVKKVGDDSSPVVKYTTDNNSNLTKLTVKTLEKPLKDNTIYASLVSFNESPSDDYKSKKTNTQITKNDITNTNFKGKLYNAASTLADIYNEAFYIWMKPAAFRDFNKLYARIETANGTDKISKGTKIKFQIQNLYDVSSFKGSKTILFGSQSWIGRDLGIGESYICIAAFALILAILMIIKGTCFHPEVHPELQKKNGADDKLNTSKVEMVVVNPVSTKEAKA